MNSNILRTFLLTLLLIITASSNTFSQSRYDTSQKSSFYIFASPNTQIGMSLKEAVRRLNSPEEISLILNARELACRLDVNAKIVKALGSWSDGAENSSLIKVNSDDATARYMSAQLGYKFKQKSVLIFRRNLQGAGRMYVITMKNEKRNPALISKALDVVGGIYRTIVPGRHQTRVYIIDLENKLRRNIVSAIRTLRAQSFVLKGVGEFTGDDNDVQKAQKSFGEIIEKYEASRPQTKQGCKKEKSNSNIAVLF